MAAIQKAAVIGGGLIGGGWIARLLLAGVDVAVFDPDPKAAVQVGRLIANAERAMARLWPHTQASPKGELRFCDSIAEAVSDATLIQESTPERLEVKRAVHREIGTHANATAVIGSSTSGLLPSAFQAESPLADRVLVAHPYNPVYLLPVVEIVGGKKTSPDAIDTALQIYAEIGMKPVHIKKEIDAFVGDRLLEAMWRESLWLINDGIATTQEIDDIVRFGLGLRFAQMGQFMTYRLGGGDAGMRHFLKQFEPTLKLPWTKLMDVPEWNDRLIDRIAEQNDAQAGGVSVAELEEVRDNTIVGFLKTLHHSNWGAGTVLKKPPEPPLNGIEGVSFRGRVANEWADYNQHMTEFRYLEVFSKATDTVLEWVGAGPAYAETGASWYTLETHIRHLNEVAIGKPLEVKTHIIQHDKKRLHLFHEMSSNDILLATGEHMLIHVNMAEGRSTPMPDAMLAALGRLADNDANHPLPEGTGASIGFKRRG